MKDAKTTSDLKYYWNRLKNGDFDQDTIKGVLLAGRSMAPRNSVTRDLGNIVAHTTRKRGYAHDHIRALRDSSGKLMLVKF